MKKISWHELKPQVKEVWVLSLPAILTQITTIVMQYIDSAMVGSLGANASADRFGIHEHMAAGRHYIRRFGRLFRAGGA